MIKKIILFFVALQVIVVVGVVWAFARSSDGKLSWAQEAWRRMNADQRQHCFDVVKESHAYGDVPSIRMISGDQEGNRIFVHYRIVQQEGRFEEHVHECSLVDGEIDKTKERRQMLNQNFSDMDTQLQ